MPHIQDIINELRVEFTHIRWDVLKYPFRDIKTIGGTIYVLFDGDVQFALSDDLDHITILKNVDSETLKVTATGHDISPKKYMEEMKKAVLTWDKEEKDFESMCLDSLIKGGFSPSDAIKANAEVFGIPIPKRKYKE